MPPDIPYSANRTLPMSLTHCQICDTRAARLTCAPCTQASLWPRRTEFLFLAAERDGAAERVHEYLEASGSARGALDDCRVKSDEKREEYRRINDVLMGGMLPPPTLGWGKGGRRLIWVVWDREEEDGDAASGESFETAET